MVSWLPEENLHLESLIQCLALLSSGPLESLQGDRRMLALKDPGASEGQLRKLLKKCLINERRREKKNGINKFTLVYTC